MVFLIILLVSLIEKKKKEEQSLVQYFHSQPFPAASLSFWPATSSCAQLAVVTHYLSSRSVPNTMGPSSVSSPKASSKPR